jgi:hypothetical protein
LLKLFSPLVQEGKKALTIFELALNPTWNQVILKFIGRNSLDKFFEI